MRDSFGGIFMIKLFLIFIILYVGFIAMALNYAKAFKAKNLIIDYIEINEITDLSVLKNGVSFDRFNKLIDDILDVYNINDSKICSKMNMTSDNIYNYEDKFVYCNDVGFMIIQSGNSLNTGGVYYTVSTYVNWNLPFLSVLKSNGSVDDINDIKGTWKITGETRIVVRD